MSNNDEKKKKLGNSKVCTDKYKPQYEHMTHVSYDEDGHHEWRATDPKNRKNTIHQNVKSNGSYDVHEGDDERNGLNLSLRSLVQQYVSDGHSLNVDGHSDHNFESTHRTECAGDIGQSSGKNYYRGTAKKEVKWSGDGAASGTAKGSSAVKSEGYTGSVRRSYEKDLFSHVQGNHVIGGEKSSLSMFQEDVALNVGQNWDNYVGEKGKIETGQTFLIQTGQDATVNSAAKFITKSSSDTSISSDAKITVKAESSANITAQEITITADTKITLKVGGSTIVIDSSGITINSAGTVDINGAGAITTQGATTKIQGGGAPGIPTTFT
jgi:hypothetical protein